MSKLKIKNSSVKNRTAEEKTRRSNHLTFIIFIIISSVFWLLIKLSQEYSQTYDMQIIYKDVPANKLLTQKIDSTVKFNIKARGFYLVELSLLHPDELIVHLKNYTIHKADEDVYYISTLPLKENIARLLDISPSNISFSKNILSFLLEKLQSKKVKVINDITLEFSGSFNLYKPVSLKPAEVMVYGPKSVLDTIEGIKTKHLKIGNIMQDKALDVDLVNPLPELTHVEPDKVMLSVKVAKFTQSGISIPINTSVSRYTLETFPKRVTVYFDVALKDYDKVNAGQFTVSPVIENVDLKTARKLNLKVTDHPDFVRNIMLEPDNVEFIIIK